MTHIVPRHFTLRIRVTPNIKDLGCNQTQFNLGMRLARDYYMQTETMHHIIDLIKTEDLKALSLIDSLTHRERILVRTVCEVKGYKLPRNLYYDYSRQCWID